MSYYLRVSIENDLKKLHESLALTTTFYLKQFMSLIQTHLRLKICRDKTEQRDKVNEV